MESIKYGNQGAPKGAFERRGVERNPGDASYMFGKRDKGFGSGKTSGAKQSKSQGLTGTSNGRGANGFKKSK